MNKSLEQVKEFHQLFEHPIGNIDELEPLKVRQLRIKLLFEELAELAEASDCRQTMKDLCSKYHHEAIANPKYDEDGDNVNQIEEVDALCDIQYVLNGKILTAGYQDIFDENFDIVHQNNMTKAHLTLEDAEETCDKNDLPVTSSFIKTKELNDGSKVYLVYNKSGKLIKPHNHTKVKLFLKKLNH